MKSRGAFRFFSGKLKIITLPAYSAELNPVEKLSMTQRNYWEDSYRALSLFFHQLPALGTKRFEEMPLPVSES